MEQKDGLETVLNGLETMAEEETGYRELLCVLEMVIELDGWFGNDERIYRRAKAIQEKIIPEITYQPGHVEHKTPWGLTKEINAQHDHMTIYAAEAVAEYWLDQ